MAKPSPARHSWFLGQGQTDFTFHVWELLSCAAPCNSSVDLFLGFVFPLGYVALSCFHTNISLWINGKLYLKKKSALKFEFCRVLIHALAPHVHDVLWGTSTLFLWYMQNSHFETHVPNLPPVSPVVTFNIQVPLFPAFPLSWFCILALAWQSQVPRLNWGLIPAIVLNSFTQLPQRRNPREAFLATLT